MLDQATRLSQQDWERFHALILDLLGIDMPEARKADLERAIVFALAAANLHSVDDLYALLKDRERGRTALEAMIPTVTVGETHFFRNRPQMEALEKQIIPDLIERNAGRRKLRIWSAACSSGEEPYSLAMIVDRLLGSQLSSWDVLIHATDINHRALEKARDGIYGAWSFREVPADVQEAYFQPRGDKYEVDPRIRRMVTFSRLNLVDDKYPSLSSNTTDMDLVVCRNVLIYFREETIRQIVGGFHQSLKPDGWLVVGHAEPSQEIFNQFAVKNFPGTIVYRKPGQLTQKPSGPTAKEALAGLAALTGQAPEPAAPAPAAAPPKPAAAAWKPSSKLSSRASAAGSVFGRSRSAETKPAPRPVTRSPLSKPVARPAPAAPSYDAAVALVDAGKLQEALWMLGQMAEQGLDDGRVSHKLAQIHASRRELDAAEHWIGVALARGTRLAPCHYLHGVILQEQGRLEEAIDALRRCTYVDAEFVLGHHALSTLFARTGQQGRAKKELEQVERLIAGRDRNELVPEGDDLTFGRLAELVELQRRLVA